MPWHRHWNGGWNTTRARHCYLPFFLVRNHAHTGPRGYTQRGILHTVASSSRVDAIDNSTIICSYKVSSSMSFGIDRWVSGVAGVWSSSESYAVRSTTLHLASSVRSWMPLVHTKRSKVNVTETEFTRKHGANVRGRQRKDYAMHFIAEDVNGTNIIRVCIGLDCIKRQKIFSLKSTRANSSVSHNT
jgi:hypothetical protein